MCGRVTLATPAEVIAALYGIEIGDMPELVPRYNIAPTQPLLAVRSADGRPTASLLNWGFRTTGGLTINARVETASARPLFREAFARRRCLVPADGFYEWQVIGKRRQPFHFRRPDGRAFSIAGLWGEPLAPGEPAECVLLTAPARGEITAIHDRMPVILPDAGKDAWLRPDTRPGDLDALIAEADAGVVGTAVSLAVNDASYDAPDCLRPVPTFLG